VKPHLTILAPCGMLGYGIPERSLIEGMKRQPDVLGVDAGSTDPGPYYLGAGKPFTNERAYRRDMAMVLEAAHTQAHPPAAGLGRWRWGHPASGLYRGSVS
jgi:hypothetical protein